MNFQQELKIDQYALDKAALEQPELFAKWAMEWADAVKERDRLKDKLALVRGQCDQEIRETPTEFGWQKPDKAPSEAFIASAVITHIDYVECNKEFQEAQHNVNVLQVAKEAFEQRRKMIEILTQLYLSSYFSGNKKLDKGYQEVLNEVSATSQESGLAASPRLATRRKLGANADDAA